MCVRAYATLRAALSFVESDGEIAAGAHVSSGHSLRFGPRHVYHVTVSIYSILNTRCFYVRPQSTQI